MSDRKFQTLAEKLAGVEGNHNQVWTQHPANKKYQTATANVAEANVLESFEAFILGPDEKKIEEKIDTRTAHTSYFHFNKEDHTLGNLLRSKLLSNSHVMFSAYRVPHPLFPTFELRVQTDGEVTPKEALLAACKDLISELGALDVNFKREYELRKMVGQDGAGF